MIYSSVIDCIGHTPLVRLGRLFAGSPIDVIAKLEMLNPGGSAKDRPAKYIIEEGLRSGAIHRGTHLLESTSGNLGIALAMVARAYEVQLTCVVDPKISRTNLEIIKRLGAQIDMVTELDEQGGYLNTRVRRVKQLEAELPGGLWLNQYANENNWLAHYHHTGKEIVDDPATIDDVVHVNDQESIDSCLDLLTCEGILAGGSSGAVIAGIRKYLHRLPAGARLVTLLPDRGERYMNTVYDPLWQRRIGDMMRDSVAA